MSRIALHYELRPHTNAGLLAEEDMEALRPLNVSVGLRLESTSERLCGSVTPHHRAPYKRPSRRIRMIEEARRLHVPFTTGILIGMGDTPHERIESRLELRRMY